MIGRLPLFVPLLILVVPLLAGSGSATTIENLEIPLGEHYWIGPYNVEESGEISLDSRFRWSSMSSF